MKRSFSRGSDILSETHKGNDKNLEPLSKKRPSLETGLKKKTIFIIL